MTLRLFALAAIGAGLAQSQTAPQTMFLGNPQSVTVTANLASTGYTIPANFVGWSAENWDMTGGYYAATQTSFVALAKLLGTHGILRIGGITSDTASAPGLPALTQPMANGVAAFLSSLGSGWTLIYGLDACDNSAAHALTQAGYLITAMGVGNVTFHIGNEPPNEVCGYNQSQWTTVFNAYYTSITGTYASARFAGPETTNNSIVQTYVNSTTPGVSGMSYVSSHWYPYGIGISPVADQLISVVYNNDTVSSFNSYGFQSNSAYAPGKLMMTEDNTRAGCGLQGVSDRLMASAYYLNVAMSLANDGWLGYQPHNAILTCYGQSHNGYYNAFVLQGDGGFAPSPIFYGMYLFSRIEGQVTAAVTTTSTGGAGAPYVRAIATVGANGNANILVQNNRTTFPVSVVPAQSAAWTKATALLLSGVSCADPAPLLGGAAIGESGAWTGAAQTISNGQGITVPPCGAVLFQILP